MKEGKPVGVKVLTESDIKWLTSPSVAEKTLVEKAMSTDKANDWNTVTVPNPNRYPSRELYFAGHIDSDLIIRVIENVLQQMTDMLNESLMKLGNEIKMVVMDPKQETDTPMDTEAKSMALQDVEAGSNQFALVGQHVRGSTS